MVNKRVEKGQSGNETTNFAVISNINSTGNGIYSICCSQLVAS